MAFVGIAMVVTGVLLGVAALVFRSTLLGAGICAVLALTFAAMGLLQYGAAGHFKRIVTTRGHDIDDLMIALRELANAYGLQRWLWIVLGAVLLIGLAGTAVGS